MIVFNLKTVQMQSVGVVLDYAAELLHLCVYPPDGVTHAHMSFFLQLQQKIRSSVEVKAVELSGDEHAQLWALLRAKRWPIVTTEVFEFLQDFQTAGEP